MKLKDILKKGIRIILFKIKFGSAIVKQIKKKVNNNGK